jgi:tetratricopeptide (TPR) repeat protein
VFSTPESGEISDTWTAVKIIGGDDLTEDGAAFVKRYGIGGFPRLLAVTAGGDLVASDLLDGRLRDTAYIVSAMKDADARNEGFKADRTRLLAAGDPESLTQLASLYEERWNHAAALALYERVAAEHPTAEAWDLLLKALGNGDDRDAEREALDKALARFPHDERRMGWRIRRAVMHIEPPSDPLDEEEALEAAARALESLRTTVASENDSEGEAEIRIQLATIEHQRGGEDARDAHLAWVMAHAADGTAALDARILMAEAAIDRRDKEAARTHLAWVIEKASRSVQAAKAHMLLGDLAYDAQDLDTMEKHFGAVVELVPGTTMARDARGVLDQIRKIRERRGQ